MNDKVQVKEKALEKSQKPTRRHTIALSTLDLLTNREIFNQNSYDLETLTNNFVSTNSEEINCYQPYNEFNFLTNQELRQQLKNIEKNSQSHIFRQSNKSSLDKDLSRIASNNLIKSITSKSIGNIPSLTIKTNTENILKQTIGNLNEAQENQVKSTILNLSPLSISTSSVTTGLNSTTDSSSSSNSSSINSLINNTNKSKIKLDQVVIATNLANEVGSITKTAVNTISTESKIILDMLSSQDSSNSTEKDSFEITNKFHSNFVKQQNIQFNCAFESLI
jgi:hypothetical protein